MLKGHIAFASGATADYDIFIFDLESKELKQLTSDHFWNDYPRISPDKREIAFVSNRSGKQEIWLMDVNGENLRSVTPKISWAHAPTWAPDGKQIAFSSVENEKSGIYAVELTTGEVRRLTTNDGVDSYPDWSPKGDLIAFASCRSINQDICLVNVNTLEMQRVTSHPAPDFSPAFSPDAKKIAFVSQRSDAERFKFLHEIQDIFLGDEDMDVWVGDLETGDIHQITTNRGVDRNVRWSPDGDELLFTSAHRNSLDERIMMCELVADRIYEFPLQQDLMDAELERGIDMRALTQMNPRVDRFTPSFVQTGLAAAAKRTVIAAERHPDWR